MSSKQVMPTYQPSEGATWAVRTTYQKRKFWPKSCPNVVRDSQPEPPHLNGTWTPDLQRQWEVINVDRHLELLRLGSRLRPSGMNGSAGQDDSAGTAPLHGTQPLVPRHIGLDLFPGLEASQMREEKLMGPLWPSPRDVTCVYC